MIDLSGLATTIQPAGDGKFKTSHVFWDENEKHRFVDLDIGDPVRMIHTKARLFHENLYGLENLCAGKGGE